MARDFRHGGVREYGGYTGSPEGRADMQAKADAWRVKDLEKARLSDVNYLQGRLGPILFAELGTKHAAEKEVLSKRITAMTSIPSLVSELRRRGIVDPMLDKFL